MHGERIKIRHEQYKLADINQIAFLGFISELFMNIRLST